MVSLETFRESPPLKYVHVDEYDFQVTSSIPLSKLTECAAITKPLPGRIGRYILPKDSVITVKEKRQTLASDIRRLFEAERSLNAHLHRNRMNHLTVQKQGEGDSSGDDTDEEEEDYDEEDDPEDTVEGGETDVEEYDWDEDTGQNNGGDIQPSKE